MTKLSPIKPTHLIRILQRLGFTKIRQKGSHIYMGHRDGRATVAPFHKGEDIPKGLLAKILDDIELNLQEFNHLR